jgi:prepilin-type N-terminal cleavage/methylation domain-containing protein
LKKAFTLIELLVVIAIIAILAAILFPVFAQAKEAAKNSSLLSNVKQGGTAAVMYSSDYDDLIPPTMASHPSQPIDLGWQDLVQPYMKNYDIVINPKRPRPDLSGPNGTWLRLQHFGIPARAATNTTAAAAGTFSGTHNGLAVIYDGVGGFVNLDPAAADWAGRTVATSLSFTSIEDISTTALIVEGNNFDAWWSLTGSADPLRSCIRWTPAAANITGGNYAYAGPTTSTRATNGLNGYNGTTAGCSIPQGMTTYVRTDSSAKAVDFRSNMYNGQPSAATAGVNVIKAFNPMGR